MNELMNAASKAADHASQQSDRWVMFFLGALLIALFIWAMRYMLKRDERKSQAMHDAFNTNTAAQISLGKIIERNSAIVEHNADILEQAKDELRRHGVKPQEPCRELRT